MIALSGAKYVVKTFVEYEFPEISSTKSVKVPPISTPSRADFSFI